MEFLKIFKAFNQERSTAEDIKNTATLEKTLQQHGLYEAQEETLKREEVLGKLNEII